MAEARSVGVVASAVTGVARAESPLSRRGGLRHNGEKSRSEQGPLGATLGAENPVMEEGRTEYCRCSAARSTSRRESAASAGETTARPFWATAPGAWATKPRDGVDPATGRRISTPVGLLIKPFLQFGSRRLWATAHFGPGGAIDASLHPDSEEAADSLALVAQARDVCTRLGVGPRGGLRQSGTLSGPSGPPALELEWRRA